MTVEFWSDFWEVGSVDQAHFFLKQEGLKKNVFLIYSFDCGGS